MTTVIILSAIFILLPVFSLWKREYLVFFTLLIASQALGLIHEYTFGFKGYFDINSILFIIFIFVILISFEHARDLKRSLFARNIALVLLICVYALIYPWATGLSSLLYCIKAAKECAIYVCYFAVFLFIRTRRQVNMCWSFVSALAVYYSLLQFFGGLFHGYLFTFLQYTYRPEQMVFSKVYLPIFTIINVSFFNSLYRLLYRMKTLKNVFAVSIHGLGVLLTFFRAYILATIFTVPALLYFKGGSKKAAIAASTISATILLSLFVLVSLTPKSYEEVFDSFIGSGITELYHYEGGSLRGRDVVAKGRSELVKEKLWTGWGFLAWDSEGGKKIRPRLGYIGRSVMGGAELGFVDKGYLDVTAKFGIIGCFLFYGSFLGALIKLIRILRLADDAVFAARVFACASLIVLFLCVQLTHAPLTRQFGIVPLSIAMALVDREYALLSKNLHI